MAVQADSPFSGRIPLYHATNNYMKFSMHVDEKQAPEDAANKYNDCLETMQTFEIVQDTREPAYRAVFQVLYICGGGDIMEDINVVTTGPSLENAGPYLVDELIDYFFFCRDDLHLAPSQQQLGGVGTGEFSGGK